MLGDVVTVRNRKARKMAQRRLVEARKLLREKKKEEFYFEVSRALWGYVADKLGLPPAELSLGGVCSLLQSRGASNEVVSKLTSTIEQCEFARFAPSSMDGDDRLACLQRAREAINELEQVLRHAK